MRGDGTGPRSGGVRSGITTAALWVLAIVTVSPVAFVVLTSLKSGADYRTNRLGLPNPPTLENIADAWERAHVAEYATNSFVVVGVAVVLILLTAVPASYAFVHLRFPLRRLGLAAIVALMLLPPTVLMVPIFRTVQQLGLLNTIPGLALVYAALNLPFSMYLMTSYMRAIPVELYEAATMDGASIVRRLTSIAVPLTAPGILTVATLNFVWLWNELLFSLLILQQPENRTLIVGVALLRGQHTADIPLVTAGLFLSMIPPVLIFVFLQRSLARGLTAGAVR